MTPCPLRGLSPWPGVACHLRQLRCFVLRYKSFQTKPFVGAGWHVTCNKLHCFVHIKVFRPLASANVVAN